MEIFARGEAMNWDCLEKNSPADPKSILGAKPGSLTTLPASCLALRVLKLHRYVGFSVWGLRGSGLCMSASCCSRGGSQKGSSKGSCPEALVEGSPHAFPASTWLWHPVLGSSQHNTAGSEGFPPPSCQSQLLKQSFWKFFIVLKCLQQDTHPWLNRIYKSGLEISGGEENIHVYQFYGASWIVCRLRCLVLEVKHVATAGSGRAPSLAGDSAAAQPEGFVPSLGDRAGLVGTRGTPRYPGGPLGRLLKPFHHSKASFLPSHFIWGGLSPLLTWVFLNTLSSCLSPWQMEERKAAFLWCK